MSAEAIQTNDNTVSNSIPATACACCYYPPPLSLYTPVIWEVQGIHQYLLVIVENHITTKEYIALRGFPSTRPGSVAL